MPFGFITLGEEMRVFLRIMDFYRRLYPRTRFQREEKMLRHEEIGKVFYTYAGDETQPLGAEKYAEMEAALGRFPVPAILLKKGRELILLDGHRRLRLAWRNSIPWKALLMVPDKKKHFAIEDMVMGRIADMY
ncbi:MAG: hypothetical protein PHS02_02705 [Candidatus ainarchaeum sp.]|nr:hypothetical protein [Candidatus ainarchaeum sp.]